MASRIIHLAITDILAGKYVFKDINRLKIGVTLPDASAPGQNTERSHLKIQICGLTKKTYDLTRYRKEFGKRMKEDDLYLGYYLHLVQDILFRYFMYEMHRWDSKAPGNVDRLHNDYALINTYVIEKYQLRDDIMVLEDFADEPIHALYPFGYKSFYEELKGDYEPYREGSLFFFTQQKADEFIGMAVEFCLKELDALSKGQPGLDEYDWGWKTAWNAAAHSLHRKMVEDSVVTVLLCCPVAGRLWGDGTKGAHRETAGGQDGGAAAICRADTGNRDIAGGCDGRKCGCGYAGDIGRSLRQSVL